MKLASNAKYLFYSRNLFYKKRLQLKALIASLQGIVIAAEEIFYLITMNKNKPSRIR